MTITFVIFIVGLIIFFFSLKHYKSLLNPLGVFTIIWTLIPMLYNLNLSPLLKPLHNSTYIVCYVSLMFFVIGCILKTQICYSANTIILKRVIPIIKVKKFYFIFFILCLCEVLIKTPPLLSSNPFAAYMDPNGIGARFFHVFTMLLPVSFLIICIDPSVSKLKKLLLFLPPFFFITVWLQRGVLIWFLLAVANVILINSKLKSQTRYITTFVVTVILLFNLIGNFRTSGDSSNNNIIKISHTDQLPSFFVWPYIYATTSLSNIDQTINNYDDVQFRFGYDILQPFFALGRLKSLDGYLFPDYPRYFVVRSGFNVPTYLYWIYINFGLFGFILIPLILGYVSQFLFNKIKEGIPFFIVVYAIWFPFLIQSAHDFLFWKLEFLISIITVLICVYKFRVGNFKIKVPKISLLETK